MNRGRFIIGAIVGAAAGVVAGLLTAPKSGKETRANLKDKAAELKETATRKSEVIKNRGKKDFEQVKERAEDYREVGEKVVADARQKLGEKGETYGQGRHRE